MTVPRRFRQIIGWVLAAVVLAFLVVPVLQNFDTVRSTLASPNVPLLLLGAVLLAFYFVFRALLWWTLTQGLSVRTRPLVSVRIWFLTEFSRYLPGNVWSFLGRAGAYKAEGVPVKESAVTLLREAATIVAVAASIIAAVPSIFRDMPIGALSIFFAVGGALGMVLLLLPLRLRSVPAPNLLFRVLSIASAFAAWLSFGWGSAVVLRAFHAPLSIAELAFASIGSWLLGYVSLITPSGLGVREAALQQYLILRGGIPSAIGSAFALTSRLVLTLVEVILVVIVLIFFPKSRAEQAS